MAQLVKSLPVMQETWVRSLSREDLLEKGMATHSGILTWRIPWTEEPGGIQSMRSQRVRHDWVTNTFTFICVSLSVFNISGGYGKGAVLTKSCRAYRIQFGFCCLGNGPLGQCWRALYQKLGCLGRCGPEGSQRWLWLLFLKNSGPLDMVPQYVTLLPSISGFPFPNLPSFLHLNLLSRANPTSQSHFICRRGTEMIRGLTSWVIHSMRFRGSQSLSTYK